MQFIDLSKQRAIIQSKLEARIINVLNSGKYIMGNDVFDLEQKLANYVGVKHCITCSSGTDALLIPLMAKGIGVGDAIITTPFSFIATSEVISLLGATPVFIDICSDTFNLNSKLITEAIEYSYKNNLEPKAIIPVDLFGLPAEYESIEKIASKYNLFVLEDAAQSFGGKYLKRKACSFGNAAATSFFPSKPLGCYGDGGAIFTDDDELAHIIRSIRIHGGGDNKHDNVRIGLNGRLDTLQAAILLEKFAIFPEELISRNKVAEYYTENLPFQCKVQYIPNNYMSAWAQYSILLPLSKERKNIIKKFEKQNIPSMIYYETPLHLQKVFNYLEYQLGDFPVSEEISKKILSIPMYPYLTTTTQDEILETLHAII